MHLLLRFSLLCTFLFMLNVQLLKTLALDEQDSFNTETGTTLGCFPDITFDIPRNSC